jgi:hypothetical protein
MPDYKTKSFEKKSDFCHVGFFVTDKGKLFAIDKQVPIVDGLSDEGYVEQAKLLCVTEVEEWINTQPGQMQAPTMEELKLQKWQAVQAKRDQLEQSGFMFLNHPIDSDPIAVQRISIATLAAQAAHAAGQPFQVAWKCKDDHVLPLDLTGMMGMSAALAMYANGLHTYGRTLKDAIYAVETQDALDAIDIESGWSV